MENNIRNIFPGGNTPKGFYSYYNHILPQREAEKIFCIKGGPGVGKSTFMKHIGEHFAGKGEAVEFLWCSSDPDSLDGIVLKERNIAMVDGTAPHIVDPKNPGAVDVIIDLGQFRDDAAMRENRDRVIWRNERISEIYSYAYGYLECAGRQYSFMSRIFDELFTYDRMRNYRDQLDVKLDGISAVRRAENRVRKNTVLGKENAAGKRRKLFAGAITPGGLKNDIPSIIRGIEKVIIIETPVGFGSERILSRAAERLTDAGFDIEEFYCPMFPDSRVEHIVCDDAGVAIITDNEYHSISDEDIDGKATRIRIEDADERGNELAEDSLAYLRESSGENIMKAIDILKKAKAHHDILEEYFIPNMDFSAVEEIRGKTIEEIEEK